MITVPDGVVTPDRQRTVTPPPPMWQVILLNDDVTPAEFVIELLVKLFQKTDCEAIDLMLKVHKEGRGVAGVYTKEIAETRVTQVRMTARNYGHPLQSIMEQV